MLLYALNIITQTIQYKKKMFKRLFSGNQIQKAFIESKIDNKHTMISTRRVVDLAIKYFVTAKKQQNVNYNININNQNNDNKQNNININLASQKSSKVKGNISKRQQLIQYILKKLREDKHIMRIKMLVLCHSIICKTGDEQFMKIMEDEMDHYIIEDNHSSEQRYHNTTIQDGKQAKSKINPQNLHNEFIQKKVMSVYSLYLKKFILNTKTFNFACRFLPLNPLTQDEVIQVINNGFIVINLINYILNSQSTFNKMGRYYPQHQEILNVFIMYINDLIVYNRFVKNIVNLSMKQYTSCSSQTIKYHYLFITQAQKSSDRLYQFFYNRYFYRRVRQIVCIPTFLDIHNDEFKLISQHVKKHDKEFFLLVDSSKYVEDSRNKTNTMMLDQKRSIMNKTDVYERTKIQFQQMLSYIKDDELSKTFDDIQTTFEIKKIKIAKKYDN